ncbi:MAG: PilZ domain-containing protein [Acidobacteria bacterium Pan2503]|uniref:PilZ domain-containing protein n=1 Tax=Candidatus Acidiferrum panamense TaxID=2741543 RepID=A0A7V8SVB8_9BACT|nr:PilZ domain-containing protein [Candidatus Acidoferrum panamensis]
MRSRIKRRSPRYPIRGEFEGAELPSFPLKRKAAAFRGQVSNISDGGFCLFTARAPKQSVLLQGPLKLAGTPAQIPTLVQVRWVEHLPHGKGYRIGLQYVV